MTGFQPVILSSRFLLLLFVPEPHSGRQTIACGVSRRNSSRRESESPRGATHWSCPLCQARGVGLNKLVGQRIAFSTRFKKNALSPVPGSMVRRDTRLQGPRPLAILLGQVAPRSQTPNIHGNKLPLGFKHGVENPDSYIGYPTGKFGNVAVATSRAHGAQHLAAGFSRRIESRFTRISQMRSRTDSRGQRFFLVSEVHRYERPHCLLRQVLVVENEWQCDRVASQTERRIDDCEIEGRSKIQ